MKYLVVLFLALSAFYTDLSAQHVVVRPHGPRMHRRPVCVKPVILPVVRPLPPPPVRGKIWVWNPNRHRYFLIKVR